MLEELLEKRPSIKKIQEDLKEIEPALDILIIALSDYRDQHTQSFIDRLNDKQYEEFKDAIVYLYDAVTHD